MNNKKVWRDRETSIQLYYEMKYETTDVEITETSLSPRMINE